MYPGIAAASPPTIPPTIVYKAMSFQTGPTNPKRDIRSLAREKIQSAIGNGISIGWTGCSATVARVSISHLLAGTNGVPFTPAFQIPDFTSQTVDHSAHPSRTH